MRSILVEVKKELHKPRWAESLRCQKLSHDVTMGTKTLLAKVIETQKRILIGKRIKSEARTRL